MITAHSMQINGSANSATQDPCAHPSSKDVDKWKNLAHLSWTSQVVLHKQMKWSHPKPTIPYSSNPQPLRTVHLSAGNCIFWCPVNYVWIIFAAAIMGSFLFTHLEEGLLLTLLFSALSCALSALSISKETFKVVPFWSWHS